MAGTNQRNNKDELGPASAGQFAIFNNFPMSLMPIPKA
jgi:hypothetical protein